MLEWAARLRRRDTPATVEPESTVAAAYRANLEPIYRFIYQKVGNRETAEDLTEDVFAKAVRGLHAGHAPQAVQAWLYATARTTIVDYWRARGGETVDIAEVEGLLFALETGTVPVALERTARRVNRLLAALPERERRVLELRFLRGYTLIETARELGMSEGNVKVVQHRALKRAATLEGHDDGRG